MYWEVYFVGIMKCFAAWTRPFHFDLNSCFGSSSSWQQRVSHEVPAAFFAALLLQSGLKSDGLSLFSQISNFILNIVYFLCGSNV